MDKLSGILGKRNRGRSGGGVEVCALEVRNEPKVRALIASGNELSRRVAERLGITFEMKTELNGNEVNSSMRERT